MIRCIMSVMPIASDTHRHSHVCPSSGGGLGKEDTHDSVKNASADLWEIKKALWLVSPASNTGLFLFPRTLAICRMWEKMMEEAK